MKTKDQWIVPSTVFSVTGQIFRFVHRPGARLPRGIGNGPGVAGLYKEGQEVLQGLKLVHIALPGHLPGTLQKLAGHEAVLWWFGPQAVAESRQLILIVHDGGRSVTSTARSPKAWLPAMYRDFNRPIAR